MADLVKVPFGTKNLLRAENDAMSTLYQKAYHDDMKNNAAWYEQKWPRTYPIGDDSLSRSTWRSFAPFKETAPKLAFYVNKSLIRYHGFSCYPL